MDEIARDAWSQLRARVRAFVARRISQPADVDDVVQDVFLRVHGHVRDLRDDEAFEGWMARIARNAVIDHYRRRRPAVPLDEAGGGPDPEDEPPEAEGCCELAGSLRPFIDQLPAPYRDALRATELDGLPQAAAAERAGISLSGMKSRVQRGRARLRDMLQTCCMIEVDRYGCVINAEPRCCPGGRP
ncbi:RNA polymerase sigma factor SigZ [Myxococcota bacterium]|nr:RNA polymerase sigma factor SigZ [Myxococcota bacterium]